MLNRYVAVDLETTGLDPARDNIIEIGLVRVVEGRLTDKYQTLVRPDCRISATIRRITGIEDAMLDGAPGIHEVLPGVLEFIGNDPILGHNVGFDCKFLEVSSGGKLFNTCYDTSELARIVLPASPGYRLAELCKSQGIDIIRSHRALEDALAASNLYQSLLDRIMKLDAVKLSYLAAFLNLAGSAWGPVVQAIATGFAWENQLKANTVEYDSRLEVQPRTEYPEGTAGHVNPEEIVSILGPVGILAKKVPGYGIRPQQIEMAREVAAALNGEKLLLVEAGTGTGKSIAYLLPAILWASAGGSRVVISTKTINLQEQLWEKDMPMLMRALKMDIPSALAKGRQNYVCLKKWQAVFSERKWTPREALFYARMLVWLDETMLGDRAELNLNGQEQEMWLGICGDSDSCTASRCRWFSGDCYVNRARIRTEAASLIITNHSLLFADIKADNRVLPAYGPLILDEAHHLEDIATEQLSSSVSWNDFRRWLNNAGKTLTKLLEVVPPADQTRWREVVNAARDERALARQSVEMFFELLYAVIYSGSTEDSKITRRLKKDMVHSTPSVFPVNEFSNMLFRVRSLLNLIKETWEILQSWLASDRVWEPRADEIERILSEGGEVAAILEFNFSCRDEDFVYWVEAARSGDYFSVSLHSAPVKVDELIYNSLFKEDKTVVMTSATLTVNGDFKHFMDGTGLALAEQDRIAMKRVESPFQYEKQTLLCVVKGMPGQADYNSEKYVSALVPVLTDIVNAAGGRTLVLFTSHRVLKETYHRMKYNLEEQDVCILGHNIDGARWRLLEEFKNNPRAVLFGTSSFWEGVDIPGEALSCVVIVKLPFQSPAVPVVEARMEYMENNGKNSFYHYSLPQAVIRFKQGFGRLIRSENDRGVVVVLDSRLLNKKYGRFFLNSLPVKSHFRGDPDLVIKEVGSWLEVH